jgi:hypothetical protein
MSGPGRPTLCKPDHAGRTRALCARGATNPDLLEPALWVRQQNEGRKGRKGRKPPAETLLEKLSAFFCLTSGVHSSAQHRHRLRKLRKFARWVAGLAHMATPVVSTGARAA